MAVGILSGWLKNADVSKVEIAIILLSLLPVWVLPIPPFGDWAAHTAISSQIHYLLSGMSSPHYHLDFGFLGYSFVHLALAALQYIFSTEISSKIMLSLIMLSSPLCLKYFLHTISPHLEKYWLIGALGNYSVFFYIGMGIYLLASNLALVLIALCHGAFAGKKTNVLLVLFLAVLVFTVHYVAAWIAFSVILLRFIYFGAAKKNGEMTIVALAILLVFLASILTAITNHTLERDATYFNEVSACASGQTSKEFNAGSATLKTVAEVLQPDKIPIYYYSTVFPFNFFFVLAGFAILVLLTRACAHGLKDYFQNLYGRIKSSFCASLCDKFYFSLALVLLASFFFIPFCVDNYCFLNFRVVPFILPLILVSISINAKPKLPLRQIIVALIAVNILWQGIAVYSQAQIQGHILASISEACSAIPEYSNVFVTPSRWTYAHDDYLLPLFGTDYYSLTLSCSPTLYVSGLYLPYELYVLRSDFPIFDEMAHTGPNPYTIQKYMRTDISACYANIPKEFDYVISANATAVKN